MPRQDLMLAILFADIANSTHLYDDLGDQTAQQLIGRCLSVLADVTRHNAGRVVKTIGDEILCTFPSPVQAVHAARQMHEAMASLSFGTPPDPDFSPPNIYVGIQYGHVIQEGGDVFGDAVNMAARMAELAKQRQILTTEETIGALAPGHEFETRCIDRTTVKGKSGTTTLYEIVWEQQDVTVLLDNPTDIHTGGKGVLALGFGPQGVNVSENQPLVNLGRQVHNDLIVNDHRVSRSHARIEYRRGKFFLVDQSTNGTFTWIGGEKRLHLKRDEVELTDTGIIGLGREVEPDSPLAIHFTVNRPTDP